MKGLTRSLPSKETAFFLKYFFRRGSARAKSPDVTYQKLNCDHEEDQTG